MVNWTYDKSFRLTSPFGPRKHPVTGIPHHHTGVDLVKSHKAPIGAFVAGQVMHAGEGKSGTGFGNMGNVVAIKDDKSCLHCYVHLDSVSVRIGQLVTKGQEIGKQGNTGKYSTASHLHYEIRKKSSPSFGWDESEVNRCHEPTQYLIDYYGFKEEDDQPMTNGERTAFEKMEKQVGELTSAVTTLAMQVKAMNELVEAPAWFVKEFGNANLDGQIHDPKLTAEGWRILAIGLRARESFS